MGQVGKALIIHPPPPEFLLKKKKKGGDTHSYLGKRPNPTTGTGAEVRPRCAGGGAARLRAPSAPRRWFGWPGGPVPPSPPARPIAIGSLENPLPTAPQRRASPRAAQTHPPRIPWLFQFISGWGIVLWGLFFLLLLFLFIFYYLFLLRIFFPQLLFVSYRYFYLLSPAPGGAAGRPSLLRQPALSPARSLPRYPRGGAGGERHPK